jgi:hypothetical protein
MKSTFQLFIERNTNSPEAFLQFCARSLPVIQSIAVITRLNIPDLTANDYISFAELAEVSGASEEGLRRVLGALCTIGLFDSRDDAIKLSADGEHLRRDHPSRIADSPMLGSYDWAWAPWGHLYDALRSDTPAFNVAYGQGLFEFLSSNEVAAAQFNAGMAGQVEFAGDIINAFDFGTVAEFVDVGGGIGGTALAILKKHLSLNGVVFDLPSHQDSAAKNICAHELNNRCSFVGGSFFDSVPASECYVLRYILHDWSDSEAIQILTRCREALKPGGVILVADEQLESASSGSFMDLQMLVFTGGKERSLTQLTDIANAAGLNVISNTLMNGRNALTVLTKW